MTDPLIGALSDRTRSPFGRRRPWIVAGAIIAVAAAWLLFTPSPLAGPVYFLTSYSALILGWTMIMVPYRAWGMAVARSYHARTLLSTFFVFMGALGSIIFMAAPLLPFLKNNEFNLESLRWVAIITAILLPGTIAILFLSHKEPKDTSVHRVSVMQGAKMAFQSRLFLRLSAAYLFGGMATGAFLAVFFIYVDSYLGIGGWFSGLWIASTIANVAAIPVSYWLIKVFGKHIVWAASVSLTGICCVVMALLPHGEAAIVPMFVIAILFGLLETPNKVAPLPLVADVSDEIQLRTGMDEKGSHIAFMTLLSKANGALGAGLAFGILQYFNYRVGEANTGLANQGLLIALAGLPAALYLAAGALLWRFPLDRRRHDEIRQQLEVNTLLRRE